MPAIAARDHIVACHDVTDSRYVEAPRGYDERFFGRGPATKEVSVRYNIGWLNTQGPQFLPLMDFLRRNDCEMRSPTRISRSGDGLMERDKRRSSG
jgi:hypothetical protein